MDFNNMNNQNPNYNPNQNTNPYQAPFPNQPQSTPVRKSPADGLINAAMVLGISAIVSALMLTVYFPFILGSLSIILALLSKGYEQKIAARAKVGIVCSIVGLVFNFIIVGASVHMVISNPTVFQQFDEMYESIYGESFSDVYEELTGEEFNFN